MTNSDLEDNDYFFPIRSYVLRQRRITKSQHQALALYTERYILPLSLPLTASDIERLEEDNTGKPLIVEIGCGYGEATAQIAWANPKNNYIAFDVHKPGLGSLMNRLESEMIGNVRIICGDAMRYIPQLFRAASITGFHVFFPDPWRKARHYKRRLIRPSFVHVLAEKLISGGYIHVVTDWENYAQHIQEVFDDFPDFMLMETDEIPQTKYQKVALKSGRKITAFRYHRR